MHLGRVRTGAREGQCRCAGRQARSFRRYGAAKGRRLTCERGSCCAGGAAATTPRARSDALGSLCETADRGRRVPMFRLAWATAVVALAGSLLVGATAAGPQFPARIDFPAGWAAEGIFGKGHTFWAGNTQTGSIYKGDV